MKKTVFVLLSTLLLSILNVSAQTWQIGNPNAESVTATLSNGTLTIQGTGNMQNYNANEGMAPWLVHKDEVLTVIIEEGVTSIGQLAFQNHTSLTNVFIPSSLTSIGGSAFQNCTVLAEIIVKNPVPPTSQGMYPFSGVNTKNCILIVPVGSEDVYRSTDGWRDFNIVEEGAVPMLCKPSASGNFGIEDALMWYVCERTTLAIRGKGDMPDFAFPREEDNPDRYAPWISRLERTIKQLIIEEGITRVGEVTVYESFSLEDIVLPNSLKSIGMSAFVNCYALKEINFPEGLITIENGGLANCPALSKLTIPSSVTSIGNWTFSMCGAIRTIVVKNPIPPTLDGANVFDGLNRSLCTLTVPKGCKVAYEAVEIWKDFNIVEGDFTSIDLIDNPEKTVVGYYNYTGQRLGQEPESGLYIIVYDDGTAEKRLKKSF